MFDWVQNNKRFMQILLALVFLPFAFFGVESYFQGSDRGAEVARLGDYRISQQEFQQALRERQEAVTRMLGGARLDAEVLDSPEMRFAALEQLIRDRLLLSQALRSGIAVSDAELQNVIASQATFQDDGRFSLARYQMFLKAQNMTDKAFEARLRRDLSVQPLLDAFGESGFVPATVGERLVRLSEQSRETSVAVIAVEPFLARVAVDEAAARAWYDSRSADYRIPEQVRVEYVALSLDNIAAQTELDPAEARKVFDENPGRFAAQEEREASHILIRAAPDASTETKAAARAQAEALLKQARAKPDAFADLARKSSQDPGSAGNGGSLGLLVRGATTKTFDEALFAMRPGEIAGPVETEFGYHILRLDSVRGGKTAGFDDVKSQIESELKRQRAAKRYAEMAEQLSTLAYEQSESLKPAAEALKLTVQTSPWLTRKPAPGSALGNERFLAAVFSEDVLKNKRNSEAIEVASGTLVAARVADHKPASLRPFEEVRAEIVKQLTRSEAAKLAAADGREKLEKLRKGEDAGVAWGKPLSVSRAAVQGLPEPVLRQVFRVDPAKLPAYAGIEDPQAGYTLVRVTKVTEPETVPPETRKAVADQLRQFAAQEQLAAYVERLKAGANVKMNRDLLEKKQ